MIQAAIFACHGRLCGSHISFLIYLFCISYLFIILTGDGAGVGKGRTIAGIIYENYLLGRKRALWLSVSNDLKHDAQKDLHDIGASIQVYPLNKVNDAV